MPHSYMIGRGSSLNNMARPRMTQERRRQILEAAAGVIAERGICDTRIADIAEKIGISPALILYYFSSKDRLLAEALAHRDQQFFERVAVHLDGTESAVDRLSVLIDASCPPSESLDRDDNEWQLWLEMWSRSRQDPELARERFRMDEALRTTIAEIVAQGIEENTMTCNDPSRFAMILSSLIDGLGIQVLLQDPGIDGEKMKEICHSIAASELSLATR